MTERDERYPDLIKGLYPETIEGKIIFEGKDTGNLDTYTYGYLLRGLDNASKASGGCRISRSSGINAAVLAEMSESDLLGIRGIGYKRVEKIKKVITSLNVQIK